MIIFQFFQKLFNLPKTDEQIRKDLKRDSKKWPNYVGNNIDDVIKEIRKNHPCAFIEIVCEEEDVFRNDMGVFGAVYIYCKDGIITRQPYVC
jgi:hypothetical protein